MDSLGDASRGRAALRSGTSAKFDSFDEIPDSLAALGFRDDGAKVIAPDQFFPVLIEA
jgi:hypothetical protein